MAEYEARIRWQRAQDEDFAQGRYSRAHRWEFDGGAVVPGSASPLHVKPPYSDPAAVDPEEALVAAASSCHMLYFLYFAAQAGLRVDSYDDPAVGVMTQIAPGRQGLGRIVLRPDVVFGGAKVPDDAQVQALHHQAHEHCYIANTVRSDIVTEGRWRHAA